MAPKAPGRNLPKPAVDDSAKVIDNEVFKLSDGGYIEFLEGCDRFDLYQGGLADRIAHEVYDAAQPKARTPGRLRKTARAEQELQPNAKSNTIHEIARNATKHFRAGSCEFVDRLFSAKSRSKLKGFRVCALE